LRLRLPDRALLTSRRMSPSIDMDHHMVYLAS
jgi:hypothetical protein